MLYSLHTTWIVNDYCPVIFGLTIHVHFSSPAVTFYVLLWICNKDGDLKRRFSQGGLAAICLPFAQGDAIGAKDTFFLKMF